MAKSFGNFMKGMGMGVAVGCTMGVVGTVCMEKNKKGLKKNAGKALHNIGDFIDTVSDLF